MKIKRASVTLEDVDERELKALVKLAGCTSKRTKMDCGLTEDEAEDVYTIYQRLAEFYDGD